MMVLDDLRKRGRAVRRWVQQGEEQRIPDTTPLVEQVQEDESALTAFNALQQESEIEKSGEQVALWVGGALLFGAGVWAFMGGEKGAEYFAGYLLEQSLSVDNLFVFILVFDYFQTPVDKQQRVLEVGIATAAVLRLVMILLGIDIIESFEPILLVFAAILVVSSLKLLLADEEAEQDLSQNPLVKLLNRVLATTDKYVDDRFFVVEDGVRKATPLLLALAVIELSDVVFAVDSIPAVFGITLDPFIVYSSNMFAILSLRSLYGFVSTVMNKLVYLDKSVALVLGFIGFKMLADFMGYHVSTEVSLGVVASLLAGGVLLSLGTSAASSDAK